MAKQTMDAMHAKVQELESGAQQAQQKAMIDAQSKAHQNQLDAQQNEMSVNKELEIERIRAESKEHIATMEANKHAQIELEKVRATIAGQIEIAQIKNKIDANGVTDTGEIKEPNKDLENILTMMAQAIEMIAAPKETQLITDENGKAIGSRQVPSIQVKSSEELQWNPSCTVTI